MRFNCCCCFDSDLSNSQIGRCNDDHIICNACVQRGIENAIGEMREFKCPDSSVCANIISEPTIQACVADTNLKRAYFNICTRNALRDIQDIQHCAFCEYGVIVEAGETVFHCITCDKLYCIACKCDAHENGCLTDIDRETERQISAISIRCCSYPPIIKIDACNHVSCLCGTEWCWYCKGIRSANRPDIHHCLGGCPTYADPRGFTIDVTQAQATEFARTERVRISTLRDINISVNAARVQQEQIRVEQAELQRQELQLSEQMLALRLENTRHIEVARQQLVAQQAATVQLRIDTAAIKNQHRYIALLIKQRNKVLRIQQDEARHAASVIALVHGREINTRIRGLLVDRTNILEEIINL